MEMPRKLARRLEILKILQGRTMSTQEIADRFRGPDSDIVDTRTVRKDLEALRDGIDVLGTTVRIEETTTGHSTKSYRSTAHPLFLALNLTELTALLKLLEDHSDDAVDGEVYGGLFDSVYSQITDYAEEKISPHLRRPHTKRKTVVNRLEDEDYRHIIYLLKSGQEVSISYTTKEGKRVTRKCRVTRIEDDVLHFRVVNPEGKEFDVCKPVSEISIDWESVEYR